ncbi:MAG: ABC transporter permease, partial [Candidatus Heimdallarchaeaceae archaeon]
MSYIRNLFIKTFRRRIGKNMGTLIAISLGVSLMVGVQITITSFATEATNYFVEAIGEYDIVISGFGLPISNYQDIINKIENSSIHVAAITARISQDVATYNLESGLLEKGVNFVGIDLNENPVFGSFYDLNGTKYEINTLETLLSNKTHILAGEDLLNSLNASVGSYLKIRVGEFDQLNLKFDYKTFDVKVVGAIAMEEKGKEYGGRAIWTSLANMRNITGFSSNECSEINIALSSNHKENPVSSEEAYVVEEKLKTLLNSEEEGLLVVAFRALVLETADKVMSDVLIAFNLFGALIIFSGVLLLVNIQLIQVEDRIQQLGILRAIGSRRREIVLLIMIESVVLGFFGSFLGIGGGYGMSIFLVWQIGKTFFDTTVILKPTVTFAALLYSIILGLSLSVGAGVFPAIRAARVDVIEVIRGIKKLRRKKTGSVSLSIGLALFLTGITVLITQNFVYDSFFTVEGWNTAIEQWMFMGGIGGIALGISLILGYLFSRKVLGNGIGLSFITISVLMLLFALPQLKDLEDNNKILTTLVVVLALGSIIWVGVNLKQVTNLIQKVLYKT